MSKIFVFSYSGFSDCNANGKTYKALLKAWEPDEIMQFYCGQESPDFDFCHRFFKVTDKDMIKAFFRKNSGGYIERECTDEKNKTVKVVQSKIDKSSKFDKFLKKRKYNFVFRTLREIMWQISPWGRNNLKNKINEFNPDVIIYMVGESPFMDKLVLKTVKKRNTPLILYNCEAYRIVDLKTRKGLERAYYKKNQKLYTKLIQFAELIIYNSDFLKKSYCEKYSFDKTQAICLNSSMFDIGEYSLPQNKEPNITYFGNLGVGRVESILDVATALRDIKPNLKIYVYGNANEEKIDLMKNHPNIEYRGYVDQQKLRTIREEADVLLQVESFDKKIVPKLKFAFSTKIAQCLCSGRCLLSYAPKDMAATQYLIDNDCACIATSFEELKMALKKLLTEPELIQRYAQKAKLTAIKNHNVKNNSQKLRLLIEESIK